ncbi:MAG: amidohydrolase family protein [Armatimonadetes bacterium]|nr:amidohydrolase family protein [Armatimonadota bacterium]
MTRVALIGRRGQGNDEVEQAFKRYPHFIAGLAHVVLDVDTPQQIREYAQRGFRGLKVILPSRNYDDPAYYPVYQEAAAQRLVILFHTGVVGGRMDDPQRVRLRPYGASSARMHPIFVDTIAMALPALKIIGAHVGYPMYDEACAIARFRPSVFFDISGGETVRRHLLTRDLLGVEIDWTKVLFGSDASSDAARVAAETRAWMAALRDRGVGEEALNRLFYGNAASLFGLE